jgi:endonuclease YncB( thermonuclease family)
VGLVNRGSFGYRNGDILTSTDGSRWTSRIKVSSGLNSVAYVNPTFIALGNIGTVLQSAPVGLRLSGIRPTEPGVFRFILLGEAGQNYQIEASNDLTDWLPLRTHTATGLTIEFEDAEAAQLGQRFYRARSSVP